jgi:hypothetical protein
MQLVRGRPNLLSQSAITLHSQGLIEFTSIHAPAPAGSALAATRVRRKRDIRPGFQVGTRCMRLQNRRGNFVPWNPRITHQGIFAAIRIQITSTQPDHPHTEENLFGLRPRLRNILDNRFAGPADDQGFHICESIECVSTLGDVLQLI